MQPNNICMVCDFFYPNVGGVESHIYQLSQCLMNRGHKVVIVTHSYSDRTGIRYMTNGMKVYYLPLFVIYNQCTLPTLFTTFPIIRNILIRERINIVHGHSAFSALALETIIHAKVLGIKTVFTDHSLFGFSDASAIITNIFLSMTLSLCNRVICVSHTGKENTASRANVNPETVSVIPNAIDNDLFVPDFNKTKNLSKITIVVISRLVYRKGIDLLATIIPIICRMYSNIEFIIGGDGNKRAMLNDVIKQNKLENRVQLIGAVKNDEVRNVLIKGDIFLNSSLTEAFCIAIVEAVSCGLQVVTTNVGGIPEVLPSDLIWLGEPTVDGLIGALERAIKDFELGNVVCPSEAHSRIREYYQWPEIAKRTEIIYDSLRDSFDYKIDDLRLNNSKQNSKFSADGDKLNDENDYNKLNILNNAFNNKPKQRNGYKKNGFVSQHSQESKSAAPKKVLYDNQMQFIDLNYLRENQDKTGFKNLLKQCYRSSWFFGSFLLLLLFVEFLMKVFYDWWSPKSQIDISPTTILVNKSTEFDKASNQQNNKIRIEANNNTVLKINKYKNDYTNCDLYRIELDRKYFVNLICEINQHNQFTFHKLSDLSNKSTNLVRKSTNLSTNCGLKTNELIDYKTVDSAIVKNDTNNDLIDLENINHCQQVEHIDKLNSYEATESTVLNSEYERDEAINDDEDEQQSNEEESMQSNDFTSNYSDYTQFSNDNLMQTIQFDDDEFEQQEKISTNSKESTSGYNTSNSCDSDNNSTNSSNLDLGNLSSYQSIDKSDKLDSNLKIKKKSKLNSTINPTIKQKLTSLLIFNKQNREAKDFSNSKLKSDNQYNYYQNDCKRRMSILIKN